MRIAIVGGSPPGGWLGATLANILHSGLGRVVELLDLIPAVEIYPLPLDIHDPLSFESWHGGVWEPARRGAAQSSSTLGEIRRHVLWVHVSLHLLLMRMHQAVYPFCVANLVIDLHTLPAHPPRAVFDACPVSV